MGTWLMDYSVAVAFLIPCKLASSKFKIALWHILALSVYFQTAGIDRA